ncbi:MAG: DNA-directed RNA polymerase subunit P [Promethearchaeota archaeon]
MTKYICARKSCGKEVTSEGLESLPGIKCPNCGYRILYKKRPSVVRKIHSE